LREQSKRGAGVDLVLVVEEPFDNDALGVRPHDHPLAVEATFDVVDAFAPRWDDVFVVVVFTQRVVFFVVLAAMLSYLIAIFAARDERVIALVLLCGATFGALTVHLVTSVTSLVWALEVVNSHLLGPLIQPNRRQNDKKNDGIFSVHAPVQ